MRFAIGEKNVQGRMSLTKENASERLERDLNELKKRMREYQRHLVHVGEMFEETEVVIKRFQKKAEEQCKMVKRDAEREAKVISTLTGIKKELEKSREINSSPPQKAASMPDAAKRALKQTVAYRALRYFKIGCVFLVDSVAAYTLFNISKPFVF